MPKHELAAAFDQISSVYDATRDPVDPATLDAVAVRLRERGIRSVLEVGVGTGRIAIPLAARGFDFTGIDVSPRMLEVSRSKGLVHLVRATAYQLPFRERAFDTTLFVHVLHLLDDPVAALREAVRVGRCGASALVHPAPAKLPDPLEGSELDPRRVVYQYLEKEGYPIPYPSGGPRTRERSLLAQHPPDELVVVSDREVTEPLARRIDLLERRGSRHVLHVPPGVLRRAAAAARTELGDRAVTYRRVEALATWSTVPG